MDVREVTKVLGGLAMLKFFPSDENAAVAIVELVCQMARSIEQVRWLVKRTISLHNEWPGPVELRAVFCSKFIPADGINAYSSVHPDGIPSEREQTYQGIEGSRPVYALPAGAAVTADPALDAAVAVLGAKVGNFPDRKPKDPKRSKEFAKLLAETITAPGYRKDEED